MNKGAKNFVSLVNARKQGARLKWVAITVASPLAVRFGLFGSLVMGGRCFMPFHNPLTRQIFMCLH